MKKRLIFGITAIAVSVLLNGTVIAADKNDGSTYSENMRRIFNHLIEQDRLMEHHRIDYSDFNRLKLVRQGVKYGNKENENRPDLLKLHKDEAPTWSVKPAGKPDLSKLHPHEMSIQELVSLLPSARKDIYLELATRYPSTNRYISYLKRNEYLDKASVLGWRGADFIKAVCQLGVKPPELDRQDIWEYRNGYEQRNTQYMRNRAELIEGLKGFDEYKSRMLSGDWDSIYVLFSLEESLYWSSLQQEVFDYLLKKAEETNDADDIYRAAWLFFTQHPSIIYGAIDTQTKMGESQTLTLCQSLAEKCFRLAEQGHYPAMGLWVNNAINYKFEFTREEWEGLLRFADILLERGNEQLSDKLILWQWNMNLARSILHNYYTTESVREKVQQIAQTQTKRGQYAQYYWERLELICQQENEKEECRVLDKLAELDLGMVFENGRLVRQIMQKGTPGLKAKLLELMEQGRELKYPKAMFYLAQYLIKDGDSIKDLPKAMEILEKLIFSKDHFPDYSLESSRSGSMRQDAVNLYFDACSEREPGKAYRMVVHHLKQFPDSHVGWYLIGYCYEQGVGVPADGVKALSSYACGLCQNCKASAYRLGLMHENGTGVDKNLEKASLFYLKAQDSAALNRVRRAMEKEKAAAENADH